MSLVEHLSLRSAAAVASRLGDEERRAAQRALDRSASRWAEAETLWAAGRAEQGLRAAVEGLAAAVDCTRELAPDAPLSECLEAAGLGARDRAAVRAAYASGQREIQSPLGPLDGALFDESQRASRSLQEGLRTRVLDASGLRAMRRLRWQIALAGVVGAGLLVAIPFAFPEPRIDATASGYRVLDTVETWPPENAVDRDETTYWHLPPGEAGWLELRLSPPRDVTAVRIMNSHENHVRDPHRADRRPFHHASREIRVHAFAGGRRVAEVDATLERITDWSRQTVELADGEALEGVDRIRIEVRSFYEEGGGLAEVEVLE